MANDVVVGLFSGCETNIATVADDDEGAVDEIGRRIALKQLYIKVLSLAMVFLATFVFLTSLVPGVGACSRDVPVTMASLPKIPFFTMSLWAALIAYQAASFNFARQPRSVFEWCGGAFMNHLANVFGMVVLQISCILEFRTKTSILYQQSNGAWVIAFAALSAVSALLSMFTGWRAWVYSRDVRALVLRWGIQDVPPSPSPDDAKQEAEESKKEK
jgi:hypothetical protein